MPFCSALFWEWMSQVEISAALVQRNGLAWSAGAASAVAAAAQTSAYLILIGIPLELGKRDYAAAVPGGQKGFPQRLAARETPLQRAAAGTKRTGPYQACVLERVLSVS